MIGRVQGRTLAHCAGAPGLGHSRHISSLSEEGLYRIIHHQHLSQSLQSILF